MEVHARALLSPIGRRLVVDRVITHGWSVRSAAEAAGVTERTVFRWLARFRGEGQAGLIDRPPIPRRVPHRTSKHAVEAICKLRRLHMTAAEIAELLGLALSTVSAVLKRCGLGKRSRLTPPEPPNRYERRHPGELVHIDIKKLGRIQGGAGHRITGHRHYNPTRGPRGATKRTVGWECVHVAVDDHSRLAYAEVLPDERAASAIGFLRRALAFFARHGVRVERVMTDNGSAYRSFAHRDACSELGLRHITTRPYRPQTNGKAERFIQTLTRKWAHGAIYSTSKQRTATLPAWLDHYNYTRPHGSLGHKPPGTRLTKVPRNYT